VGLDALHRRSMFLETNAGLRARLISAFEANREPRDTGALGLPPTAARRGNAPDAVMSSLAKALNAISSGQCGGYGPGSCQTARRIISSVPGFFLYLPRHPIPASTRVVEVGHTA
jgi:hypothetical protein